MNDLINKLKGTGLVESCVAGAQAITVNYTNGVRERYWTSPLDAPPRHVQVRRDEITLKKIPSVLSVFESDLYNGSCPYKFISIAMPQYRQASPLERAVSIIRLVDRTVELGYQGRFPEKLLIKDMTAVMNYDVSRQRRGSDVVFWTEGNSRCGDIIVHNFMSLGRKEAHEGRTPFPEKLASKRLVHRAYRYLERRKRRLSNWNLIKILGSKYVTGPKINFFGGYVALFEKLGVRGKLLDLDPDNGCKALACARMGIQYVTVPNPYFDSAMANGLAEATGLAHSHLVDGEIVDWTICDGNMGRRDAVESFGRAEVFASRTGRLIVWGDGAGRQSAVSSLSPEAVIGVMSFPKTGRGLQSYFYVW